MMRDHTSVIFEYTVIYSVVLIVKSIN